jgi:hypothetical protein
MKSIIFITIEPCRCNGRSILPLMEDVDLHYAKAFFNPYSLNEVHLHDKCKCEGSVKSHVIKKH